MAQESPSTALVNCVSPVALLALLAVSGWAYWPTLLQLADLWEREPDYSHGYLVLPLFFFFLYLRRDTFPTQLQPSVLGVVVLALSIGLRFIGGWYFITPMDGWSIVVWFMGVALCLGGWPLLRWSFAPTLFLFFMVPLPFRAETFISYPLQQIASMLSAFLLRCLGQPAFAENTALLLGTEDGMQMLSVERTCSGLRIFVGIFALAYGYLLAFRREFWEGTLLMLSAIPVALLANALRIVATALVVRYFPTADAFHFSHDVSGWLMIPLAAVLLGCVQWYLNCLVRDVATEDMGTLVRRGQATA